MKEIELGQGRCLIIGEVGLTHDGSLGLAHAFVDALADAGADVVKFQTHIASAESTPSEPFRVKFSRQDASRYAYWERTSFTEDQWAGLAAHCRDRNVVFMSSPFSFEAVNSSMQAVLSSGVGRKCHSAWFESITALSILRISLARRLIS